MVTSPRNMGVFCWKLLNCGWTSYPAPGRVAMGNHENTANHEVIMG